MKSAVKKTLSALMFSAAILVLLPLVQAQSTVATISDVFAVNFFTYPNQRKTFPANGLFWVFYSDSINIVYRTSTDGISWSENITVREGLYGTYFSVWFDGTYLHYVFESDLSTEIYYRRGTPNADGTITWSAIEQTVFSITPDIWFDYPFITVDSAGYPWIGYNNETDDALIPSVVKSSSNDGTWTTQSGFPYQLESTVDLYWLSWAVSIVPLTSQKVAVIYATHESLPEQDGTVKARSWNGVSWNAKVTTTSSIASCVAHSEVSEGDNVHVVFLKDTTYDIISTDYDYAGNSFGPEVTVQSGATNDSPPVISKDTSNNLYVFWEIQAGVNHVYYRIYNATTSAWEVVVDWIDESISTLPVSVDYSSFYQGEDYVGLVYMTGTSPYNVRFDFLNAPSVPASSPLGHTAGPPLYITQWQIEVNMQELFAWVLIVVAVYLIAVGGHKRR